MNPVPQSRCRLIQASAGYGFAMLFVAMLCAIAAGCAKPPADTDETKAPTRLTLRGMGDTQVVEIQKADITRRIGLPVYPGARIAPESMGIATSESGKEKTYAARLETPASFQEVVKWYCKELKTDAATAKIAGKRYALIIKPDDIDKQTRTVMITQKHEKAVVQINIMLVVQ